MKLHLPSKTLACQIVALLLAVSANVHDAAAGSATAVLAENRVAVLPLVIAEDAPAATREAADELAGYIAKITGARPKLVVGAHPAKQPAVWIGLHPTLAEVWPGQRLEFNHPEEILLRCDGRNVLMAGRDRFIKGRQIEFGTANAVYEFLARQLGVRWLWPGELGEDIAPAPRIAVPEFEYRFHPTLLRRRLFARAERSPLVDRWTRVQRLKLDSLDGPAGGHAYTTWWERFHEQHPDWFALQPDGTRSGYPDPRTVKMCLSNPGVAEQWLAEAAAALESNPGLGMIMAGENDGHSSGLCVCANCRAWDQPAGAPWTFTWKNSSEKYVATTDRYVTYWNRLARELIRRFPQHPNLYVQGLAYGPSTPPPVRAVPDDNVIISYVGKFPTIDQATREQQKVQFAAWAKAAPHIFYRPNLWYWTGGAWGLPDIALSNVMEDFRFLAENHCIGIYVDTAQEHWSTQAPQYYLMSQLVWNPGQDPVEVLYDFYHRGFGPAAKSVAGYFELLETAFRAIVAAPKFGPNARDRFNLLAILQTVYTDEFLARADSLMRKAEGQVAAGPELLRKRVDFIHTGLEYTRLMIANLSLMARVRSSAGKDVAAAEQVRRNWTEIKALADRYAPVALAYDSIMAKMTGSGYMGMMEDYFGPPSARLLEGKARTTQDKRTDID